MTNYKIGFFTISELAVDPHGRSHNWVYEFERTFTAKNRLDAWNQFLQVWVEETGLETDGEVIRFRDMEKIIPFDYEVFSSTFEQVQS